MDSDQRRRTGSVDRETWPSKIEHIRNPVRGDAERIACSGICIDSVQIGPLEAAIVVGRNTDKNSGLGPSQLLHHLPGIVQGFPSHLKQKPLLGVHASRLARGNAKESGIKLIDLFKEPTPAGIQFAGQSWIRIVELLEVKTISWDLANGIPAIPYKPPERGGSWRARKAAAESDNGDGFRPHFFLLLSFLDRKS